ncbi:WD40-repeat-containing domain protein [Collybia nuda]|uniref:WD repeat-containing protein JIP5 n=1 Tax=Collybia nuda TaxID=64659 RepID=A0A9P6CMB2_9AGAR|nr:WD40-repeat-containing domain protein [Collybia nuda]
MPEIAVGAQIFDLIFHPTHSTIYTGLLTGHVKAYAYNEQGNHKRTFSLRPSKRSCRSLTIDEDGSHLYAVGKSRALNIIDTVTEAIDTRVGAHDAPINRIKYLMPWLLSTGDDDGVIKLWDPRQKECTRTYNQHFDYITDFLWLDDKKQLVATSGDGTLSVMDVRSKKPEPFAQSEDQEDELLSIAAIRGGAKVVVGTQIGILSIFNRSSGWGDCVDRIPGHPHSVDALCALPSSIPDVDTSNTILTGSSDGLVRAVKVLPTKLLGVVTDHGEWPVERIAIGGGANSQLTLDDDSPSSGDNVDRRKQKDKQNDEEREYPGHPNQGRGRWWAGSVGHEEVLRMTDLEAFFYEQHHGGVEDVEGDLGDGGDHIDAVEISDAESTEQPEIPEADSDSSDESDAPKAKKRKRKPEKDPFVVKKKKGKNTVEADPTFFDGL